MSGWRVTGEERIELHCRHGYDAIVGILETKLTVVRVVGERRGCNVGGCHVEWDIAILLLVGEGWS